MARRKLICDASDFFNIEAKWKNHSSQTENHHGDETNPTSVRDHVSVPSAGNQQHNNWEQQYTSREDEDESQKPFGREVWRETCLLSIVYGEALPHESKAISIRLDNDPVRTGYCNDL